jgi:(2R)-sulfolactate sulfo-lyase subunit alpha
VFNNNLKKEGVNAMIQFLVHEKADSVGVATVDVKAGETAKGLYMDSQEQVEVKTLDDVPLGHKIAMIVVADIKKGGHVHTQNLKTRRW